MHIQEFVTRREQAEETARGEQYPHKIEADTGAYQLLVILLFFACFGTGLFVAKIIDDHRGPWWVAVLAMAASVVAFFTCLKRLERK